MFFYCSISLLWSHLEALASARTRYARCLLTEDREIGATKAKTNIANIRNARVYSSSDDQINVSAGLPPKGMIVVSKLVVCI